MKPLLILKTGTTVAPIRPRGDFDDWFAAHLSGPVDVLDCTQAPHYPDVGNFRGVLITGSASMVSHREPWSEKAAGWVRESYTEVPYMLGVCYGHQLIAQALGGEVGPNPKGRQIGTTNVTFNGNAKEDALLKVLPAQFPAQVSHSEVVLEAPENAIILGSSAADPNHIIRFRSQVWGVQFHPEFDHEIIQEYIRYRWEDIAAENLNPANLLAGVQETPIGPALLRRFDDLTTMAVADAGPA